MMVLKERMFDTGQALTETADQTAARLLSEAIDLILNGHPVQGAGLVAVVREFLHTKHST